jgi:hypothetical protein
MEGYYVGPEGWIDGGIDVGIESNFIYTAKLDKFYLEVSLTILLASS